MTSCLITASEVTYQLLTAEGGRDVFLKCARPPARLYPAAAARTAGRGGGRPPSFLSLVLVREGAGRTGLSLREARGGFPRVPLSGFELRCCGKGRRQTSLRPPASGGRFGGSPSCPRRRRGWRPGPGTRSSQGKGRADHTPCPGLPRSCFLWRRCELAVVTLQLTYFHCDCFFFFFFLQASLAYVKTIATSFDRTPAP